MPMPRTGWERRFGLSIRDTNVRLPCSPNSPDCRGKGSFPICRLSRSGRCPVGSDDSQRLGGNVAGDGRTRTTFEPRFGYACAQSLATQVPHGGNRFDADSLPRASRRCDKKEIFRGEPKSGTTHFHAYATAVVLHKGYRYTLAIMRVEYGDSMKEVLQRLLAIVHRRGVKIRFLLLDKGFFSVEVIKYLRRAGHGFIIPAVVRGRKPKDSEDTAARLASVVEKEKRLLSRDTYIGRNQGKKENQRDSEHLRRQQVLHPRGERQTASEKAALRGVEGASNARGNPGTVSQTFWNRNELPPDERSEDQDLHSRSSDCGCCLWALLWCCATYGYGFIFVLPEGKYSDEPQLFLELLRFQEMLLWITQIVQQALGANKTIGLDRQTYERLTAHYQT